MRVRNSAAASGFRLAGVIRARSGLKSTGSKSNSPAIYDIYTLRPFANRTQNFIVLNGSFSLLMTFHRGTNEKIDGKSVFIRLRYLFQFSYAVR